MHKTHSGPHLYSISRTAFRRNCFQPPLVWGFLALCASPLTQQTDQKPIFPSCTARTFAVVPHFCFAKWRHFWGPALSHLARSDPTFNTPNTNFPFWKFQVWGSSPHLSKGCCFFTKKKEKKILLLAKKKGFDGKFSALPEEKKAKEHRALFAVSEELLLHQRGSLHMKEVLKYESDLWTSQESRGRESS